MKIRHPEKVNNPINPIKKKPNWIRTKILDTQNYFETKEIINHKKITLISIFLFLYVVLNLFDGERGLISYFEKQKIKEQLLKEQKLLALRINSIEKKNSLLTDIVDIDYLETLYRKKFMVGKPNEKIYIK